MIHPTAIIDSRAEIDSSAEIGPYTVVEGPVRLGAGCRVGAHVVLYGPLEVGERNEIHSGAVLGDAPQDFEYSGGDAGVQIGHGNVFREFCTVHRSSGEGSRTRIGDRNYLMQNSHVGHDCQIGNDTVLVSGALLAGHVRVEDRAFVSGNAVVHQFVRVGRLALLRGLSKTSRDVPPFCIMDGTHTVRSLNVVGLRRSGFPASEVQALRRAFRSLFFRRRNLRRALEELVSEETSASVRELVDFIRASKRGVCFGPSRAEGEFHPRSSSA